MSKTLKRTLIILLSALLCFSCAILLLNPFAPAPTVYAEESNQDREKPSSDEHFTIEKAVLDSNAFAQGKYKLTYGVTLNNTNGANLSNILCKTIRSVPLSNDVQMKFSLFRDNIDDNTETKLVEYALFFGGMGANDNGLFSKIVAKKDFAYYPEKITFGSKNNPIDTYYQKNVTAPITEAQLSNFKNDNYEILSYGVATGGFPVTDTTQTVPFIVETDSEIANYHVEFTVSKNIASVTEHLFWVETNYTKTERTYERDGACVQSVLREWRELDPEDFEKTFSFYSASTLEKANNIIDKVTNVKIRLKYLEQIGDTPFAEAKYKVIDVQAFDGKVTETSVLAALDLTTFKCLDAYGTQVVKLSEDKNDINWKVVYLHSSHLRAKTANGKYLDYFFDINDSYWEYYHPMTVTDGEDADGRLSIGCYEYVLNEIGKQYPELTEDAEYNLFDYGADLYGCWGFVMLPKTIDFSSAFKEIFDVQTTTGVLSVGFAYDSVLNQDTYKALVKSQEYSLLEKFWYNLSADVITGYEATTYIMVMESGVSWIDVSGEITNEDQAKDPQQDGVTGGFISDVGGELAKGWNSFIGLFDFMAGSPLALGTTMGVLLLGLLIFVLIKTGAFKNIGSGQSRQPRQPRPRRRPRPRRIKRSKRK